MATGTMAISTKAAPVEATAAVPPFAAPLASTIAVAVTNGWPAIEIHRATSCICPAYLLTVPSRPRN